MHDIYFKTRYKLTGLQLEILIYMFLHILPPHYCEEEQVGKLKKRKEKKIESGQSIK